MGGSAAISLCVLTCGREPARLAAILSLLRPVAAEIVVALDDRFPDAAAQLGVADRIILFPHRAPGDRPIAWLVGQCRGDWILNLDDDEVPSPRLVAALPDVVADRDVTHAWIARRWLTAGARRYLAQPPWSTEYQLRLFRADERFVRFTSEFHRPIECHGPARFVDAPVWHLDAVVQPEADRRSKAIGYERARRGMRIGAFSHNTGLYLPEVHGEVRCADVPADDLAVIDRVRAARGESTHDVQVERVAAEEIDQAWPGAPYPGRLYEGRLELVDPHPPRLVAGAQQTMDIRVVNETESTWRYGLVTVGTRWNGVEGIRTQLPADVRPGTARVVPVHLVAPSPGLHELEIDLVHEHVRWFERPLRLTLEAAPLQRAVVLGAPPAVDDVLDEVALVPSVEPVVVGPRPGDHPAAHLPGFVRQLRRADVALVCGDAALPEAPPTRAVLALLGAIVACRLLRRPVLHVESGSRSPRGVDALLARVGCLIATARLRPGDVATKLREFYAGGGTRTPTPEGRRF